MSIDWLEPEATVRGSVVVVAGRGERAGVYRRFARRIAFDGYRVAIVDGSTDTAHDVLAVIDDLAATESTSSVLPLVLVGSDSGAGAALIAAAQRASVTGVVAAGLLTESCSPASVPQAGWDDELDARSACPVHRGVLDDESIVERGALAVAVPAITAETLTGVRVPTLIVHGSDDVVSGADAARHVADAIADTRIVLIDGGRHDILNDVSHRSVAAEVVQFLERLRLPGAADIVVRNPVGVLVG